MLNILVPTDYSPESKNALLYALNFAEYTQSKLIIHHVIPQVLPVSDIPFEAYYSNTDEEIELLKDSVANLVAQNQLKTKVTVKYYVNTHVSIDEGIYNAYKETNADLVIMGTHGASGWRKFVIGSNTSNLVGNYQIPVLAIPGNYKFQPIYHMVYASNLKNLSNELNLMIPVAKIFQAVLEIFYFDYATPESEVLLLKAKNVISKHSYKNIKLSVHKGKIAIPLSEQILHELEADNTQILSLFRGTHNWLDSLLSGSTTQQVVMQSQIPTLVIKL